MTTLLLINNYSLSQSKSPLWAHLMAYGESVGVEEFSPTRGRVSPPHAPPITSSMSSLALHTTNTGEC